MSAITGMAGILIFGMDIILLFMKSKGIHTITTPTTTIRMMSMPQTKVILAKNTKSLRSKPLVDLMKKLLLTATLKMVLRLLKLAIMI
jgi:hypothetical protein